MNISEIKGSKLAVYGLGREGRSILRILRKRLPRQSVTLLNDTPLTAEEKAALENIGVFSCLEGEDARAALQNFEVIIKSPGISPYRPEWQAARDTGVHITSPTRLWFAENPAAYTVCITGTKGKSTSSSLLHHVLTQNGVKSALAGNIGMPLFDIEEPEQYAVWVLELSSYQCSDLDARPSLSVLLNLFPEHTDWHGDTETYYRDKLNLLRQSGAAPKLVNYSDPISKERLPDLPGYAYFNHPHGLHPRDDGLYKGDTRLLETSEFPLRGTHNLGNACAVLAAAAQLGITPEQGAQALKNFRGLPHRLYEIGEQHGIRYVDDSISTTPQSVLAALQAFENEQVVLLAGGYERHLDWHETVEYLGRRRIQAVITMGANGPRIAEHLRPVLSPESLYTVAGLKDAVDLAGRITPSGGVVLLSPGSPSYGEFKDFSERGRMFALWAGCM